MEYFMQSIALLLLKYSNTYTKVFQYFRKVQKLSHKDNGNNHIKHYNI